MQAACGLIKVGRSSTPEARRLALVQHAQEDIATIVVFDDRGADEEAVHIKLKRFRRFGEWFSGTTDGKRAIERVLQLDSLRWPYRWNPKTANELLCHLRYKNYHQGRLKRRRAVINELKHGDIRWSTNVEIFAATWSHCDLVIYPSKENPRVTDLRTGITVDAPDYLANHDIAATAGPPGWEGLPFAATPAQIVVAGLEARSRWERQLADAGDDEFSR